MTTLVTGISGYIGSLVAQRLVTAGHDVRGFARRPERVTVDVPVVAGDAIAGTGLAEALDGVEVAYFLIHSMETAAGQGAFSGREHAAAQQFADAARAAGVSRIVYLGGPEPSGGPRSDHLASRLGVESVLLEAVPDSVALRASIVIGARSRVVSVSLVRLVERLPVLAIPGWGPNRTAPIDERDVVAMLLRCAELDRDLGGRTLDAAGPDVPHLSRAHPADRRSPARRPAHDRSRPVDRHPDRRAGGRDHRRRGPRTDPPVDGQPADRSAAHRRTGRRGADGQAALIGLGD